MTNKIKLFISYSRRDKPVIKPLVSRLGVKYDLWIDWEDIGSGDAWEKDIERGVAQADVFLFLLTENSATSQWCNKELALAVGWGKRVIPILFDSEPPATTPELCKRLQYCFPEQLASLDAILERQREEAQIHSDLLVAALKWERKGKPNDLLLKSRKLTQAVAWLKNSDDEAPYPTHLHREYILTSQVMERNVLAIASTAFVGMLSIGAALLVGLDLERRSEGVQYSFHGDRVQTLVQTLLTASGVAGVGFLGFKGKR